MKPLHFAILALLMGLLVFGLGAYPARPVGLSTLVDQAQVIVVASLTGGQQAGQSFSGTLEVARTLKGNATQGSLLAVNWQSDGPATLATSLPGSQGLWFLRDNGSRSLTVLPLDLRGELDDAFLPVGVAPLQTAYVYGSSTNVLEKVLLEVGAALETPSQYGQSRLWEVFNGLPSGSGMGALRTVASSASSVGQVAALSALISNGDTAALRQVVANYDVLTQAPNAFQLNGVISNTFRSTDPSAIQSLVELSQKSGQLRTAAARSLAAIHTPQTLSALATLLDVPTPELQALATNGLSSFVMSLPVATPDNFLNMSFLKPTANSPYRTNDIEPFLCLDRFLPAGRESQFVEFWKAWWARNSAAILQP